MSADGYFSLTRPCKLCPFRTDAPPYLRAGRVREIDRALVTGTFTCHTTTVEDPDDDSQNIDGPNARHCAGALIVLERMERPSQMMRIAERLGVYDRDRPDVDAPVFDSLADMAGAQENDRCPNALSTRSTIASPPPSSIRGSSPHRSIKRR